MVDINAEQKNEKELTLNTKNIIRTAILMIKIFTASFLEKTEIKLQTNYPILSQKKTTHLYIFHQSNELYSLPRSSVEFYISVFKIITKLQNYVQK